MRVLLFLLATLVVSFLVPPVQAQNCARARADIYVENAGVRARLFNNGALFWSGTNDLRYEVPKDSGIQAIFAAGLWIGGTVEGETRFAGSDYGPYEYWPGPLGPDGAAPTPASCAAYDRIWRVTLEDIARYNETGVTTADLAEWPAEVGAPVVDGDGIADNYDLGAGERPAILGDETAWWIMNDRGGTHDWGETPPIGLEARVTVSTVSDGYAYHRLGLDADLARVLHTATLYRYELTYRGNAPWENVHFGFWMDSELGNFRDDYVGSYPEGEIAFVYNADNLDESTSFAPGYGPSPPALGVRMISGPGPRPMTGFLRYESDGTVNGNPGTGEDAYRYLRGLWRDDSPMTFGGTGYQTGPPTDYMFPALPPEFWSEANIDGLGTSNVGGGGQGTLIRHGPFAMQPGETVEITFALVFSRSDAGHFASVRQLAVLDAPRVAAVARTLSPDPDLATIQLRDLPAPLPPLPAPEPDPPSRFAVAETITPNPTIGDATLRLDLPASARVRLEIFDSLGRQLAVPVNETLGAAEHRLAVPTGSLLPGVYLYRLRVTPDAQGPIESAGRFLVAR
ncbi:MAG: T9SS type A sorting domain-containing protein [Bacteroidota bacterium]